MKTALLLLCAAPFLAIPIRVMAQGGHRTSVDPARAEALRLGGGVPSGYMILGETAEAPAGYTYSGFSVLTEPGGVPGHPTWSYVPPMLVARAELAAAGVNGKVYAIGGYNAGYLASVEEYSPDSQGWSFRAPMPTARAEIEAVVLGQMVYVFGGFNGSYLGTVEAYDPVGDSWAPRSSMPTPRDRFTTAVVGGKVLVMGGYNGGALSVVEEYDPITDTWTTKPPMPSVNSEAAAATFNGIVCVIGGDDGFVHNSSIMIYEPASATWSVRPGPGVYDHAVAVLGGSLYSFGGTFGEAWVFDSEVTSWTPIQPMPTHRRTLAAAVLGEKVYLLGGWAGSIGSSPTSAAEALGLPLRLYAHRRN